MMEKENKFNGVWDAKRVLGNYGTGTVSSKMNPATMKL